MSNKNNSNLTIEIRDPQLVEGTHYYLIKVTDKTDGTVYTQKQRYKSMREMHKEISNQIGEDKLPIFPKKRWFGSTDQQFVSQRLKELQYYFTTLLDQYSLQEPKLKSLKDFLITKANKTQGQKKNKESEQIKNKDNQGQEQQDIEEIKEKKNQDVIKTGDSIQKQEQKPKQNKTEQIKVIIENFKNELVDLADAFMPAGEAQIMKKKADYAKIRFDFNSNLLSKYQIPKGNVSNQDQNILNSSTNEANLEFKLDELAANLTKALEQPEITADPAQIVHKFKGKK